MMEYYLAITRNVLIHAPVRVNLENYDAKWKKPDKKGCIYSDSIYMKYLE